MEAEKILSAALKTVKDAEVYYAEYETTTVSFRGGTLNVVGTTLNRAAGLRVFAEGRVGIASSNDFRQPEDLVAAAVAAARFGREAEFQLPAGTDTYPAVKCYSDELATLSTEYMVKTGEDAVALIAAADKKFVATVDILRIVGRRRILNSRGLDRTEDKTTYEFVASVQRTTEDDILNHYCRDVSLTKDFNELEKVRALLDDLKWADKIVPVKSGPMDLIFDPFEVNTILLPVLTCANGAHIIDRTSALAGKLGEAVTSPAFSLIDDATTGLGAASYSFDGEGTPARPVAIIDKGVLRNYYTDLMTAATLGLPPSGHGQRLPTYQITPGYSNVHVLPGEETLNSHVANTKNGIIALFTAGGSMANLQGGEVGATIVYGLKVENGEIIGRVKNCIFAGNAFEMLGTRLRAVAKETERVHGTFFTPAVIVADQMITGNEA